MNYLSFINETALPKLNQLLETDLKDNIQLISVKKNDFLLREGRVCRYYFFVKEGILRNFYLRNGIEITTNFTLPNDLAANFMSAVFKQKSNENIQAVTDCKIYRMKVYDFEELKNKNPVLQELKDIFISAYVLLLEERLHSIQFCTAAERYRFLMEKYPQYIRQIPLSHIASYLGITPETLSRIRSHNP